MHSNFRVTIMLLYVLNSAHAEDRRDMQPDSPAGGWNVSGMVDRSSELAAAYPTPPVDRGRMPK